VAGIPTITARTWPRRPGRLADAARVGAFALGVLLLEALLAHGVSGPQVSRYIFLFIGAFLLALVFRFPMATALLFFGFTDFVFHSDYFTRSVGPLQIHPYEVVLACLFMVAAVRPKRRTWGGPAGVALAFFLAMIAISAVLGVQEHGTSLTNAFNTARPFALLALFYVIVRLFPSPEDRRLLLLGAGIIAAVAGVVALLVALGAGFGSSLQDPGGQTIRDEGIGSIKRVRLVGLSAAYGLFWYAVAQFSAERGLRRAGWLAVLGGFGLAIAVSFNRNMWLGLVIGAMLMAIFGGTLVRNRMAAGIAVAIAGIAVLMVFGGSSTSGKVVEPLLKRGETILNPAKTEKEDSLQSRAHETSKAWSVARQNLVLGVGAGTEFGVFKEEPINTGSFVIGTTMTPQLFLHNQYLYLILVAGVPGLIAFLVFLGIPLSHALRREPGDPAITGLGIGLAMIMLSSFVAIYFSTQDMTAVLALLAGVLVADMEGPARRREPSGLLA
jgi:O-antigen ligase